jgi:ApbE superfamily uncharacterized protein (UPF0280 family)
VYQERTYRSWVKADDLVKSHVCRDESDLYILSTRDMTEAAGDLLAEVRRDLEVYICRDEGFCTALEPHRPAFDAPLIARRMAAAAARYEVGPMAAVAGAIAQCVGEQLSGDAVVENGGDIYVQSGRPLVFTLYAGEESPFTGKLRFSPQVEGRFGVCTSSGTVGHSKSFGRADAVCVIARDTAVADAAATAWCNLIVEPADIERVVEQAAGDDGVLGVLVVMGDRLGMWGKLEIVR